jgi:acylphosphatase
MSQCLKIHVRGSNSKEVTDFIQRYAKKYGLEGMVQMQEGQGNIVACGSKGNLDHFLDALHHGEKQIRLSDIVIEPFFKSKDYRGVFRIIE